MPIDQRLTAVRNTPNKSPRLNTPRKGVVLHHGALTNFDQLRNLAMGAKQVSATNIVKDGLNEQLMTDGFRAWSLSSAWADSSFRSVETCNQSTNGWTISDESHWTLARNVAYWAQRDGFYPHRSGDPRTWTVIGHREVFTIWGESYATACPGGMDLDLVVRRAQGLLAGTAGAGPVEAITPPASPIDWDNMIRIQAPNRGIALIGPGYYKILNAEELAQSKGLYSEHQNLSDREFDVKRAIAIQGEVPDTKAAVTVNVDIKALAAELGPLLAGDEPAGLATALEKALEGRIGGIRVAQ